jgi:hypothetical protein
MPGVIGQRSAGECRNLMNKRYQLIRRYEFEVHIKESSRHR